MLPARLANSPHTTEGVLHLDFTNAFAGMAFDLFKELALCGYGFLQGRLQVGLVGRGVRSR